MTGNSCRLISYALAFSVSYALFEYYFIRDPSFGHRTVISLIYPYHFAMGAAFGLVAYGVVRSLGKMKGIVPIFILICAVFSSMLAVEDFTWFALRASAPFDGDTNAGELIMAGEWTTQFMGSVDAHYTAIPNWYFLGPAFSVAALATTLVRTQPRKDHLLTT